MASAIGNIAFGTTVPLPPDPFAKVTTYQQAKQLFEQFPRIRILFDNGGGPDPGAPAPRFEADYQKWPVSGTSPTAVVLRRRAAPSSPPRRRAVAADSYRYDPSHEHDTTIPGGSQSATWVKLPAFTWKPPAAGTALRTRPRRSPQDVTVIGNASVDLWLKSTAPDTDIQVTITEVRPDGKETYVQNGWLRASDRALAPDMSVLRPTHLLTEAAVAAVARRASSCRRASRCSRSRTCSVPARASG